MIRADTIARLIADPLLLVSGGNVSGPLGSRGDVGRYLEATYGSKDPREFHPAIRKDILDVLILDGAGCLTPVADGTVM